jgi:hypothetical protein
MTKDQLKKLEGMIAELETLQREVRDDAGHLQMAKDALLRARARRGAMSTGAPTPTPPPGTPYP